MRDQRVGEILLQKESVANLVRAYLVIKTHPQLKISRLVGRDLTEDERKKGFVACNCRKKGGKGS